MIICPNCNHQNPEGSVQCENCYTALPSTYPCSNCGALVQTDATFCGQCGFNLQGKKANLSQTANSLWGEENDLEDSLAEELPANTINSELERSPWDIEEEEAPTANGLPSIEEQAFTFSEVETIQPQTSPFEEPDENLPSLEDLPPLDDLSDNAEETDDLESWMSSVKEESTYKDESEIEEIPEFANSEDLDTTAQFALSEEESWELPVEESSTEELGFEITSDDEELILESDSLEEIPDLSLEEISEEISATSNASPAISISTDTSTRLQLQRAVLFHIQTGNSIEIPPDLAIIRLGKQNARVPPDVELSGFPNSEIVSRIHADIRVEGDTYFIEDRGSSNGTYINSSPLLTGNRHRLRPGDRISLGKGDLVTFLFQIN